MTDTNDPPLLRPRHGLKLVDVVILILICIFAAGIALPGLQLVREMRNRSTCEDHLRQMVQATHNAHDTYGYIPQNPDTLLDEPGTTQSFLLPFLGQCGLFGTTSVGSSARIGVFVCPSDWSVTGDGNFGPCSYATNNLLFGPPPIGTGRIRLPDSIPDGSSHTVMFAEKLQQCSWWAQQDPIAYSFPGYTPPAYVHNFRRPFDLLPTGPYACSKENDMPSCAHRVGIQVGMADGRVLTLTAKTDYRAWHAAHTPNGGEMASAYYYGGWATD